MIDRDQAPENFAEFTALDAAKYHSWYQRSPGSDIIHGQKETLHKLIGPAEGGKLLDIGCGTGVFSKWFQSIGFKVTGIDISYEMVAHAYLENNEGVSFQVADAKMLPYEDDSFDTVTFATSFEFIDDPDAAIKEALRVANRKIIFLMLNPVNKLNVERMRKAESGGGVFRHSRLWIPADMESQLEKHLLEENSIKIYGYSDSSPYYLLQVLLRNQSL